MPGNSVLKLTIKTYQYLVIFILDYAFGATKANIAGKHHFRGADRSSSKEVVNKDFIATRKPHSIVERDKHILKQTFDSFKNAGKGKSCTK